MTNGGKMTPKVGAGDIYNSSRLSLAEQQSIWSNLTVIIKENVTDRKLGRYRAIPETLEPSGDRQRIRFLVVR